MNAPYGPPNQNHASAYMLRQLEQADATQQLIMLLDGVVRFTMQAREAIGRNDIAARHNANARAMEIISFLLGQIDPDKGGEAAARLSRIYGGLMQKMMRIDFENNAAVCDDVCQLVRQLRAGFASLQPQAAQKVVAAPEPAQPGSFAASA